MKIKLILFLICLSSCSQSSKTNEFYNILNSKKENLTFTFIANFSNYFIILDNNPEGNEDCNTIDKNGTQKIIEIFNKNGILNKKNAFLEKDMYTEQNQKLAESRKLMIFIEGNELNLIITIPNFELAQKLLNQIGTELNYNDCFTKLSNEIKT